MSDKQQSAVDFLAEKLEKLIPAGNQIPIDVFLTKAKELFKQQIIDARVDGMAKGIEICDNPINYRLHETHEQYFNQTFKTESNGTT